MRHFAHHIGDYAAATAHLSFVEDAAYHRLLRLYYRDESALPAEVAACQRLVGARSKDERTAVATVLREFFALEADGWHQTRADAELVAYQTRAALAQMNGRNGGRPKTGSKLKLKPGNNPSGSATVPEEKLTINHKPITNNQEPEDAAAEGTALAALAIEDRAFDAWNAFARTHGCPTADFMTTTRRFRLRAILVICGGIAGWDAALAKTLQAQFIRDKGGGFQRWFNLDWLLDEQKFTRLMEGRYAERHGPDKQQSGLGAALAGLAD